MKNARMRWGSAIKCEPAAATGRYCGPVFVEATQLVQRVAFRRAIVHRLASLDCTTCERLQNLASTRRLDERILTIYCIEGRGTAYLRADRIAPPLRVAVDRHLPSLGCGLLRPVPKGHLALALAASFALAACMSHKLVTPNGKERIAVNTPESLQKYQDLVARQDAITLEKSELQQQVDALHQEVSILKSLVLQQQHTQGSEQGTERMAQPQSDAHKPLPHDEPPRPQPQGSVSAGTVSVERDRVLFRITHGVGQTNFRPAAELELELIKAAKAAKTVVVRGRTDSETVDDLETRIALARAVHARQNLVSNGVEPNKIHVWYRASGDFIADNSTAEGRASNRRVEIEVRGLDTSALTSVAMDERVGRNQ